MPFFVLYPGVINLLSAEIQVVVQPNPFTDRTSAMINNGEAAQATLRIMDMNGKLIAERSIELYKGETLVALTELAESSFSGVY